MEAFSDNEFYEARDEISSLSGSESSDEESSAEIEKRQRSIPRQESAQPPRQCHLPSQCFRESRFSVWQDGPKSIQERRRLLYERFGIPGIDNERCEDDSETISGISCDLGREVGHSRGNRFIFGQHTSYLRTGIGRGASSPAGTHHSCFELGARLGNGSMDDVDNVISTTANGSCLERSPRIGGIGGGKSGNFAGVKLPWLESSRSDTSAVLADGKIENGPRMIGSRDSNPARCAGSSPNQHLLPGIDRLTQCSGAVLREKDWGPLSSSKLSAGSPVCTDPSKSKPLNLRDAAFHFGKVGTKGTQLLAAEGRHEQHTNDSSSQSASVSVSPLSLIHVADLDCTKDKLSINTVELLNALQTKPSPVQLSLDRSLSFDGSNDVANKIKDLDSGKEFIIDDVGRDGVDPKLRDLGTGKQLTLEEFEKSLGLSPVMQELRRREREKEDLDDDDTSHANRSTASSKKKSLWVRTMTGMAKTVGVSRTISEQNIQRSGSVEQKGGKIGATSSVTRASKEANESVRWKSPQRVKVQVYKKNFKDLSDLNIGQEIQAHEGSIWTMKFSLDGRYLASAGQDRVVYVREVLDHPSANDQFTRDGVVESSGGKVDEGYANPECLQQSQAQSQGLGGSLRGSLGRRKAKGSMLVKLPKLFWLSETTVCSFKGHTEDVLDLSWSRSQFLLSSSMDKTVRLWHISYGECLRVFTHNDYVTCIEFSPTDDRYFLSGSLDDKVRMWSIPDHQVVDWSDVREMVTSASYSHDGKRAVIGTYRGTCRFYNTKGHNLRLDGQIDVRNAQSKKSRGKKITGVQFMPGESSKVLITSNDSRVRVYDGLKLRLKLKGLKNMNSQISATFNQTGEYIISASEDSRVYFWNSGLQDVEGSRRDKPHSYECFSSTHVSIAISWPGMDLQTPSEVLKADQSELDVATLRQSTNGGPLRLPLRYNQCSCPSRSNGTTNCESGLTSESIGECKSEQSITFSGRNGSGREAGDEEVTSRRSDGNGLYMGHFVKSGTEFNSCFRECAFMDYDIPPLAASPALSTLNDSPPVERTSVKSPLASFFTEVAIKATATWPEEKLPPLQGSARSHGGSWSASSPSEEIISQDLIPEGSRVPDMKSLASWGQVIVTATKNGKIRTFQNYGYPRRL